MLTWRSWIFSVMLRRVSTRSPRPKRNGGQSGEHGVAEGQGDGGRDERDNVVAVISGAGEVARFVRVARGTALSLEASAEGPVGTAALASPESVVGLSAGFRRVTRELGDKGFPPFFLQMVNDIRAISGAVRLRPDGATVALEVRL